MMVWSRLTCVLAILCIAAPSPARAINWFGLAAIGVLASFSKDALLLHLQARSTTAITKVVHDRPCADRRRDYEKILPLAAEAAFLASDAYADPQAYRPGVSRIEPAVSARGPLGAYAIALRTSLQGYPLPDGFPHPDGWGASPSRYYDAVFVTFRGTEPGSLVDWITDIHQAFGATPQQYQWALRYAQAVLDLVDDQTLVVFSGHSLGGGLATYSALWFRKGAITFNPAGLHPANFAGAVGDISHLRTSDIANLYHFIAHSVDGITDIVGNLSFAGYTLLPGAKYFVNIPDFHFGTAPSLLQYLALHKIDPLWQEIAAQRRGDRAPPSCIELHGRAIYIHPR